MKTKIQPNTFLIAIGMAPMPTKYDLFGWREEPATEKQKKELEKFGIAYSTIRYKGQASMVLQTIYKREADGLATPKQIQLLLEKGYKGNRLRYLTVIGASRIIKDLIR